jgi:hypothetical protein
MSARSVAVARATDIKPGELAAFEVLAEPVSESLRNESRAFTLKAKLRGCISSCSRIGAGIPLDRAS